MAKKRKLNDYICAEEEACCVGCLPHELVIIILSHLSVADLISFRCVSTCWRCAFLKCAPQIPLQLQRRWLPWFVLLKAEKGRIGNRCDPWYRGRLQPLLYTTGKLGDLSTQHIYSSNTYDDDPVLGGKTLFLLSKYGWLLLFSASSKEDPNQESTLFFYNPFLRTRIDLPYLEEYRFCDADRSAVFDISAPSTSLECTVFVMNFGTGRNNYEISTCCRGDYTWTTKVHESQMKYNRPRPSRAVYNKGKWYCLHQFGYISVYDAVKFEWKDMILPQNRWKTKYPISSASPVSYVTKHGEEVHLYVHDTSSYEVVLNESLEIDSLVTNEESSCFWLADRELSFRTCFKDALLNLLQNDNEHELQVDSFNAHAWCTCLDVRGGNIKFHWHDLMSLMACNYGLDYRCRTKICYRVVWLQPCYALLSSSTQPWTAAHSSP